MAEFSHKHHTMFTIVIFLVMFSIIALMIGPTIRGYTLSKKFNELGLSIDSVLSDMGQMKTDMNILRVQKESCEKLNEDYSAQLRDLTNRSYTCTEEKKIIISQLQTDRQTCSANITWVKSHCSSEMSLAQDSFLRNITRLKSQCSSDISQIENRFSENLSDMKIEIHGLSAQLAAAQQEYDELVYNTANNICCKYKVDYPQTDSYVILNNRIVCTTGEPSKIKCLYT